MSRVLLVFGPKTFKITIPDDAKVTFAPFSPPGREGYGSRQERAVGTLRIYKGTKDNIIGCWSQVTGFRDTSLDYEEEVAREEGAILWKSDKDGYKREESVTRQSEFKPVLLEAGTTEADDDNPF